MGFINAVKGIIAKFRAAGKSENEISGIIETAAEKATVNRGHLKKDEFPKPEIKVESSTEAFQRAILEMGITTEQAKEAICKWVTQKVVRNAGTRTTGVKCTVCL